MARKIQLNYDSAVRFVRNGAKDDVAMLRDAAKAKLDELGAGTGGRRTLKTTGPGSDNVNLRSFLRWVESVTADDETSVAQLQSVYQIAAARG